MKILFISLFFGFSMLFSAGTALGNDLEGSIESVNTLEQSFTLNGIEFFVTRNTDFDGGLGSFDDLKPGLKVEVDFAYRDNRHFALEIEPED